MTDFLLYLIDFRTPTKITAPPPGELGISRRGMCARLATQVDLHCCTQALKSPFPS